MHWFVTGCRGQLGSALCDRLARAGADVGGADIDDFDVAEPGPVRERLAALPLPLVWVNAAGFTQVDRCEREPELARRANSVAPAVLARACAEAGAQLVHVSTDYVFAGDGRRPYREDDPPAPRSVYGRTKLDGDRAVLSASEEFLVVRTSWLKTDAVRPAWSVLDTSRAEALGVKMRCWQEAVTAYLRSDHSPLARAEGTAHA